MRSWKLAGGRGWLRLGGGGSCPHVSFLEPGASMTHTRRCQEGAKESKCQAGVSPPAGTILGSSLGDHPTSPSPYRLGDKVYIHWLLSRVSGV